MGTAPISTPELVGSQGRARRHATLRDIIERKRAEEERRRKEAELKDAQRVAHVGSWYWDAKAVDALVEGIATLDRQRQERLCRAAVIDISRQKRADESAAGSRAVQEVRTPETAVGVTLH
jgi:PAS domain-containing protein